ncbi:MAG: 2-oxo-4-hydroxy-4-carboxy-5-ureidoimidazoline decarboxylase [Nocardioides sp.]|jgi:2-oxo-4-hydroxy-4-carboxy-5-ureidoimidazoline decarboxylase
MRFDTIPDAELGPQLLGLTRSDTWVTRLIAGRPYGDLESLLAESDRIILSLTEAGIDETLAGHPRIGEKAGASLGKDEAARSSSEQAGMSAADAELKTAMARGNEEYEARFGRIYLVAAAGRSAEELLAILQSRLGNDPAEELQIVKENLAKITRLRLTSAFGSAATEEGT